MFYSQCTKCGMVRRWLTAEETSDPILVEKNRNSPITSKEFSGVSPELIVDAYCSDCAPQDYGKKKK